jgi:hypothetical protein
VFEGSCGGGGGGGGHMTMVMLLRSSLVAILACGSPPWHNCGWKGGPTQNMPNDMLVCQRLSPNYVVGCSM